ncbi:sigma factor-like helix-turn-helix DNA-binding protein [Paenibacillus elgii]|uniref:sigma factor-like helix-turn-helix DNA-binding protein n=1 Tax=Paenibacillus elgii TaxID=189691 RepID=UPI0034DAC431
MGPVPLSGLRIDFFYLQKNRIVMALTYCQQLTIPQIASLLNVDGSEVRSRLYRAG